MLLHSKEFSKDNFMARKGYTFSYFIIFNVLDLKMQEIEHQLNLLQSKNQPITENFFGFIYKHYKVLTDYLHS